MKITQTDTQLTLQSSGGGSLALGIVCFVVGVVIAVAFPLISKNAGSAIIAGVIFAGLGIVLALFASNRTVILNKNAPSTIASRRIIGAKEQDQSFTTADVTSVALNTALTGGGMNNNMSRVSTLIVTLKDNSVVQLATKRSGSGLMINGISTGLIQKASLANEAQAVATFLNVPLQTANLTNPIAAVESIVDAFRGQHPPVPPQTIVPPTAPIQTPPIATQAQMPPQETPPTAPPTI